MLYDNIDFSVLLGVPNAGKSTLTGDLPPYLQRPVIGTGDILRAAVEAGTELGLKAKTYMDAGGLVPDNLIQGILQDTLHDKISAGDTGFFLDGVPRTLEQADALEAMGIRFSRVIFIDVPIPVAKYRAANRRICKPCGRSYSLIGKYQPKTPGICDLCGRPLTQRKDDAPEVVENRIGVYTEATLPLLKHFENRGIPIYRIDGSADDALKQFIEAMTL